MNELESSNGYRFYLSLCIAPNIVPVSMPLGTAAVGSSPTELCVSSEIKTKEMRNEHSNIFAILPAMNYPKPHRSCKKKKKRY